MGRGGPAKRQVTPCGLPFNAMSTKTFMRLLKLLLMQRI
jgi:hypothetical protein